ncbi:MAG TPA: hypothetical protein VGQ99_12820 [Tepidisphaeraceae bacterium]|jgi:hypothetical protein|nr:hypothetical protein [Tepidisphaeraceae bacterium]
MTTGLYIWSKTAGSNSIADASINWAEGQAPSTVNDSARAMMARIAEYRDDVSGSLLTTGGSTAYTIFTNENFDSLAHLDKQTLTICAHVTSGASPTLSVDGLTAKPIQSSTGVAVAAGGLVVGTQYRLTYYNTAGEFIVDGAPLAQTVPDAAITNAKLANMAAWTLKGNNTSGSAAPGDFTIDALMVKATPLAADEVPIWDAAGTAMKKATLATLATLILGQGAAPTVQRFTSGTSQTYTPTAGMVRIKGRITGGGGGGGGGVTNSGQTGGTTFFGSWTAIGGSGGIPDISAGGAGGTGGANGTGTLVARFNGGRGTGGTGGQSAVYASGAGGNNPFGGGGGGKSTSGGTGNDGAPNSGAGGGGGTINAGTQNGGAGGGAGEYVEFWMTAAQVGASQTYTVGAGGAGGTPGGGGVGGAGAAGIIIIEEFYI